MATAIFRSARSGEAFRCTRAAGPDTIFSHKAAGAYQFFYIVGSTAGATDFFIIALEDEFFKIFFTCFTTVFINRHGTAIPSYKFLTAISQGWALSDPRLRDGSIVCHWVLLFSPNFLWLPI